MLNIKIYQVNLDRDKDNIAFRDLEFIHGRLGITQIDAGVYDKVYAALVEAKTLEDVFYIFNQQHPQDYRARSLSVSDVVEVVSDDHSSFYFCDSIGFRRIDFDPSKALADFEEKPAPQRPKTINLWARLGVSITATPEDLEILKSGGGPAKDKLLELVRSDKCVLDGETYFPGMTNERYFSEDIEFNIGPYSLHDKDRPVTISKETPAVLNYPEAEAKVYICSGSVKREAYDGTYEECLDFCERNDWTYKDENDFVWSLDLDDLREKHNSLDDKIRDADSRVASPKDASAKEPEQEI